MANFWSQYQPMGNAAGSRTAGTFSTAVQPGAGHVMGAQMAQKPTTLGSMTPALAQPTATPSLPSAPVGPGDATATGQAPSTLPMTDRTTLISQSPAYQFDVNEGQQAIERSAAAKGTLLNGGTLKELQDRRMGVASHEYQNEFNRLADITRLGQAGAAQLSGYGSGYGTAQTNIAGDQGQNDIGLGNAQGAATIAGTNATNQAGAAVANTAGQIDWGKIFKKKPAAPTIAGPGMGTPYAMNFQAPQPIGVTG